MFDEDVLYGIDYCGNKFVAGLRGKKIKCMKCMRVLAVFENLKDCLEWTKMLHGAKGSVVFTSEATDQLRLKKNQSHALFDLIELLRVS